MSKVEIRGYFSLSQTICAEQPRSIWFSNQEIKTAFYKQACKARAGMKNSLKIYRIHETKVTEVLWKLEV